VAIGSAASSQIQAQLDGLGDNLLWIEAGGVNFQGVHTGSGGTKTLIEEDMRAVARLPFIKAVSAQVDGRVQVVYANQNWNTRYNGVSPEYFDIKKWPVRLGGPFSHEEVERAANVCVIGETIRATLFRDEDPLNKLLRVGGLPCQVIGVLAAKGPSAMGQDQDDLVLLPYTTAQKRVAGITWLRDIMCSAVSQEALPLAEEQAAALLRDRHHIRPGDNDDFNIRHPEDLIQAKLDASRTFTLLLVAIASVSLLIGGIGIMNVMLVSVTERTREIGVRMAVGATEQNIQLQFLGEAVVLSLIGGFLGVFLGIAGSDLLGRTLQWPMRISPQAILIAGIFSMAVGIFFGYYPARKASYLDPIEALRFE
jgi:putative ABC transport system permease protein